MNPNVDLTSFSRSAPITADSAGAPVGQALVGPPARLFTRYVLPGVLLLGFVALALYAFRGVWQRPVLVTVQNPQVSGDANLASRFAMPTPIETTSTVPHNSAAPQVSTPLFKAPGWIEPSPLPITVTALTSGNVKAVHVLEGQPVTSGTLVAELVEEEHMLDEHEAESMLALKQAQLEAAQADWDNPTALQEAVRTAQADAMRLKAEKSKAQSMSELSRKEAEAGRSLTKGGYESGLTVFRQQTEEKTGLTSIEEIDAKIALNQAALTAAEERLRLRIQDKERLATTKAEVRNAEVRLEQAKLKHDRCRIYALSSGVVMQLFVRPGSMISPDVENGMQVATVYDPESLQVRTEIPLADTSKVEVGLNAEVRVDAVPNRVYHGELVRIVPQADVQKNVLPVKVKITDPDGKIRPDMIAKVQFVKTVLNQAPAKPSRDGALQTTTQSHAGALQIPEGLLRNIQADTAEVFIATDQGIAALRKVKLGEKTGDSREILDGLNGPDRIISSNIDQLKPGSKIRIQEDR